MLTESRKKLYEVNTPSLQSIADHLCHQSPIVRPIFECVKVYARIHESGSFTYARHPFDLGTSIVSAQKIVSKMKCENRSDIVRRALMQVESKCVDIWPFSAGSSSWILLEILHPDIRVAAGSNNPAIIFRKASRLNSKGESSTSPLLEKLFRGLEDSLSLAGRTLHFEMVFDPQIQLENISGTGIFTKFSNLIEGVEYLAAGRDVASVGGLDSYYSEIADELIEDICESNFELENKVNPGFYFEFEDQQYIARPNSFVVNKKNITLKPKELQPPLPIFGMIK